MAYFNQFDPHSYTACYEPDQNECLSIKDYTLPKSIANSIKNASNLQAITGDQFDELNIKALFMGECTTNERGESFTIVFKRLSPSNCLSKGFLNLLLLDKTTYTQLNTNLISIPDMNHVLYIENQLLFLSFKYANEIFGLSDQYKEATNIKLDNFNQYITCTNQIDFEPFANHRIRKLVSLIIDSDVMNKFKQFELTAFAINQNINLQYNNGKLVLDLDKKDEVLLILEFLAENTFLSTFCHERTRTNSKEKI